MDDAERDMFLQRADPPYVGVVATIDEQGFPHAIPVWFRWDGRAIHLWSLAELRWPRNLMRDPRVSFAVFEHDRPYRAVYFKGMATVRTGTVGDLIDDIRPIVARYSSDPDAAIAAYDNGGAGQVAVTIEPTSIAARANETP